MPLEIKEMTIADYDEAIALWEQTEGMCLREADSKNGIEAYLKRNPNLSFVARYNGNSSERCYVDMMEDEAICTTLP
ncbi:MAG: hypothetical protein KC588_03275 [Nitrospira sp.]|nr:hypothetical protein [Nitrospira sp.]